MPPAERSSIHLGCAIAGLLATALWGLSSLSDVNVHLNVARWWSVVNVAGFGFVAFTGALLRQGTPHARWLDHGCTYLEVSLLLAWVYATGSTSSYLAAFPPMVLVLHTVSAGRSQGRAVCFFAAAAHGAIVATERAGVLDYAPIYRQPTLHSGPSLVPLVGVLATYAAAYMVGSTLTAIFARRAARPFAKKTSGDADARHEGRVLAGKYRLLSLIGRGGMGEVYSAERVADQGPVAVKLFHAHVTAQPRALERFYREMESASRLPPHHTAPIIEFGETPTGLKYIVMQRLFGEDLQTKLERVRSLSLEETVRIVERVADILGTAAARGVVHRDVKPSNIFIVEGHGSGLDVRLLDFGICHLQDGALGRGVSRSAALLGTPGFLAPEQVSDDAGEVGPHTDVFALAAVTYRALAGQNPFPAQRPAEAVYEALNHHPVPVHEVAVDVPEEVGLVLVIALAKSPSERYELATDFARDLQAASASRLDERVRKRAADLLTTSRALQATETLVG